MTNVAIQPSYGNRDAWRHWEDTLDRAVDFTTAEPAASLGPDLQELLRLHPDGLSRFWGATSVHDGKFDRLAEGDVVLFTGKKLVRGIGEIGVVLRNAAFGDWLWSPHPDRGSYSNIYSLKNFQQTEIPYEEVWEIPGFTVGDNFMGLRIVSEEKAAALLDGLRINTATSREGLEEEARKLERRLTSSSFVAEEAVNAAETSYVYAARNVLVSRAEALLVRDFRSSLNCPDENVGRLRTGTGVSDLLIRHDDGVEIVEAKRGSDHSFVRQALAQLLDYALGCDEPIVALTALFPKELAPASAALLGRFGIDYVYPAADGTFGRVYTGEAERTTVLTLLRSNR